MAETVSVNASEFKLLRDLIEKICGIALGDEKAYLIETRLAGLLEGGKNPAANVLDVAGAKPLRNRRADDPPLGIHGETPIGQAI